MPSESDLRDLLKGPDPEGRAAIDLDAVLTRARRRRRPRLVAAQALGSLALVGVLGTAIGFGIPQGNRDALTAEDAATTQESAGGSAADSAPFVDQDGDIGNGMLKAQECGEVPDIPPLLGWSVEIAPSPAAGAGELGVRVTLGQDATVPESGIATITALAIVRDGIVVGHAFPVGASVPIGPGPGDPAPWEPVTWDAVAGVESCESSGEPLPAGTYQVLVRIQYEAGDTAEPITPPPATIEIR